jgi:hypothetical protein
MSQVDKALKAFEYTTEWADLIAALGKLNKVLLAHMKYPIIPRRIVISKVTLDLDMVAPGILDHGFGYKFYNSTSSTARACHPG